MPEMMGVRIQNGMTPRLGCVLIYTLDTRWLCRIYLLLIAPLVSHVRDALEIIYKAQSLEYVPYFSSTLTTTYYLPLYLN